MTARTLAREAKGKKSARLEQEAKEALERENDGREWTVDHKLKAAVLRKAFQLHVPACGSVQGKNCVTNPNCLHGLGQLKEGIWLENPPHFSVVPSCLDALKGDPLNFAGLRNLGATCYLNSLLQCLFMNLPFRRAIYEYRGPPDAIMLQLQELFVALQSTTRAHIDPTLLVDSLQIPQTHQQDVQEFNNLLLNKVGRLLRADREVDVVSDMFNGELGYNTRCENCNQISARTSSFSDLSLQIRGKDSVLDSLQEHFLTEKFDGQNQYFCTNCKSKQNALRETYMQVNPPVLQLHLMRFEYDPESRSKTKLSDNIFIPAQLDLNQVQSSQKKDSVYHLTAILRHRGGSAHFGHYVADVLDQIAGDWWRFNDINVLKTGTLGGDDDDKPASDKVKKGVKRKQAAESKEDSKDGQRSRNAYMLVYTRGPLPNTAVEIPDALAEMRIKVESKDEQVSQRVAELASLKASVQKLIDKRKEDVENMLSLAPVPPSDMNGRLVSTQWLKRWLIGAHEHGLGLPASSQRDLPTAAEIVGMFDPGKLLLTTKRDILCPHEGVDPQAVSKFKLISEPAWKVLAQSSSEIEADLVRGISEDRLCEECARNLMKGKLEVKHQAENQKALYEDLSHSQELKEGFLVCSQWHRVWASAQKAPSSVTGLYASTSPKKSSKTPLWDDINQHLLCIHSRLAPGISKFKIVSKESWRRLLQAHPTSTALTTDDVPCPECSTVQAKESEIESAQNDVRKELRKGAARVANDFNEFPQPAKPPIAGKYTLVTAEWQRKFKEYMDQQQEEAPAPLAVRCLRCTHGQPLYEPFPIPLHERGTSPGVLYLMDSKCYAFLAERFGVDGEPIGVTVVKSELPGWQHLQMNEQPCNSCIASRILSETQSRLSYDSGELEIIMVKPGVDVLSVWRGIAQGSSRTRGNSLRGAPYRLKISSTVTVQTLKMRILQEMREDLSEFVMYVEGNALMKMDMTLSQANVKNGCKVYVQPQPGVLDLGMAVAPSPELGFLGTALVDRFPEPRELQPDYTKPPPPDLVSLD